MGLGLRIEYCIQSLRLGNFHSECPNIVTPDTIVRTVGWFFGVQGSELGICEPGILRFRRARHVEDVGVQQVPFQVCIGSIPHPVMSTKKDYGRCIEALLIPNLRAIALGWIDRRIAQIKLAQTTLGPEKNQSSQSGLGCRSKVGGRRR